MVMQCRLSWGMGLPHPQACLLTLCLPSGLSNSGIRFPAVVPRLEPQVGGVP